MVILGPVSVLYSSQPPMPFPLCIRRSLVWCTIPDMLYIEAHLFCVEDSHRRQPAVLNGIGVHRYELGSRFIGSDSPRGICSI